MEKLLSEFSVGLFFWQLILYLLLLFLLKRFAWNHILTSVKNREDSIKEGLESAEEAKEQMRQLKKDNQELLAEARKEKEEIIKSAREAKDQMIADANPISKAGKSDSSPPGLNIKATVAAVFPAKTEPTKTRTTQPKISISSSHFIETGKLPLMIVSRWTQRIFPALCPLRHSTSNSSGFPV